MSIVEDFVLSLFFVGTGTVYTITEQIAAQINVTGVNSFGEHSFEHPFLLMTVEFLAQFLCLLLWYIITGGVTLPRNARNFGRLANEDAYAQPEDEDRDDNDDALLPMAGNGNIQDGHLHGDDDGDDNILNIGRDEGEAEEEALAQRQEIIPNNPAWNQDPVDQTKFNMFLFAVPAFFDLSRYGLMFIAIKLAYNSSFMLSRSAAVLFTVLLRVAFLSKHMAKYMWISIWLVVLGIGLFGMTDFVHKTPSGYDKYGLAAGCLLMVMSQIMIAMQIVFEEKFMDKHSIHPLRVIGLEGMFGFIISLILLIPFSFIKAGNFSSLYMGHLVDINDAFMQIKSSWVLALCFVGRIVSKSANYYTGLRFVSNQHDTGKRITIDVHHDLIIWTIALGLGWQNFFFPQVIGYILVPIGMLVYCDVIPLPAFCRPAPVPPPAGALPEHVQLDEQEGGANVNEDAEADALLFNDAE